MIFESMRERGHERVLFVQEPESGLRAIVAIHSTRLGPALGGVRRWSYATENDALEDVLRLSEAMTYKAASAHLPMGGAKSVIMLDQPMQPATEAAARAIGRFVGTLRGDYIAAEDVGVDAQFIDWMAEETCHVMGGEKVSRGGDPSPYTAQGVVNGMKAALRFLGESPDFSGKIVAVQGLGHVGMNIVRILAAAGARIIGADISAQRVEEASIRYGITRSTVDDILYTKCDILCPCALGGVVSGKNIGRLNCRMLVPAANNVLDDPFEDAAMLAGRGILYGPDFVVNAGGLIHLAGLWLNYSQSVLDEKIARIEDTTLEILRNAKSAGSAHAAAREYAARVIEVGPVRPASMQASTH